jgi:GNAT superfamily N-acetyltransferase
MHVGFHHAHLDKLLALWNACLPEAYQVTPEVFRHNTIDCPVFDWGASVIEIDDDAHPLGFAVVKRSASELYKGPDPDQAHVSAVVCPEPNMGVDLLSFVKKNLINRGVYKLIFGQDSRHFFAGCPTECTSLKDLLTVEGFVAGGEFWDVSADLSGYNFPVKPQEGFRVGPITANELLHLDMFLHSEFPGRWHYDVMAKVSTETNPGFVKGLWEGERLRGFALTQQGRDVLLLGAAGFAHNTSADWCSLGPIGVAKAYRGKGLGDLLLAESLLDLKAQGKRNCVIDWTGLKDWYGKHGFEVSRTYTPFSLRLDEV